MLAPGGRIVLTGQDWQTIIIDSDNEPLTHTIIEAVTRTIPSPQAARRSRNLLCAAGFDRVAVEVRSGTFTDSTMRGMLESFAETAITEQAVSREQAAAWLDDRAATDRGFVVVPIIVASARRP